MGNCCRSKSSANDQYLKVKANGREESQLYHLPKVILSTEDAAIIYVDTLSTKQSIDFRHSLEKKIPNLILFDGEKRILNQIELMKEEKFYLILVQPVQQHILTSMIYYKKIKAIYFSLQPIDLSSYPKSTKIKGFFNKKNDLEKAIYYDIRLDQYS